MLFGRRPWREELAIIDRTMKAISGISDPEDMVSTYWDGIGELLPIHDYIAVSRRGVEPPNYLITRSSRFTEEINPWKQRDRLPRMAGGIMGEIAYANEPVFIDDLPGRLKRDDPAHFYLDGFQSIIALPQYVDGVGLNVTAMLLPKGREIDPAAIPLLHWQSGLFGRGTQNLVLRNELGEVLATLDKELQVVGDIQKSLLPAELPQIPGFEMAAWYQTSARAGGDYYDFFPLDQHGQAGGGWGLFIADVSGHGTPAAVLMAITHAIAHAEPGTHTPPAALLRNLNNRLTRSYTRGGTFITAFYAVLDPHNRTLTYTTAGHNPPRLARGGEVISLEGHGGLPLGIIEDEAYEQRTIQLEPGDLLLLYTDGITESRPPNMTDESLDLFGTERLDQLLIGCHGTSAADCIQRVRSAVDRFTGGAPPKDDQTLIALRCL